MAYYRNTYKATRPAGAKPTIKNPNAPASEPQRTLLRNLARDREIGMELEDFDAMIESLVDGGVVTMGWISGQIEAYKALPFRPRPAAVQVAPGYYVLAKDGAAPRYYVVVKTKDGERTYAKQLTPPAPGAVRWTWEYVKGAVTSLAGLVPLTVEEASAWGHLNGFCIICGKRLDNPKSVQAGIGPVCIKKVKK